MKKIIIAVTLACLAAALLAGCWKKAPEAGAAGQPAAEAARVETGNSTSAPNEPSPAFPLTVKDDTGFEMTIENKPSSIVSLTLGSDEILMDLVDQSRIKALTIYADDPGISNIAGKATGVKERVRSNSEKIISLKPDLVIIDSWANPDFITQVRAAGIKIFIYKTPSNVDEQKAVIEKIARITGEEANGKKITGWMDEKLKQVQDKLSVLKPEDKLTVIDYGEQGSSGKGTNFDDIVTRAGLVNLVSKAGMDGWPTLSKEKVVEMNPDIMVIPSWFYDKKNTLESFTAAIKNDKSLATVKAVKNNRLISLPNPHMSAISQYVVLGIEDAAKAAYPELFK